MLIIIFCVILGAVLLSLAFYSEGGEPSDAIAGVVLGGLVGVLGGLLLTALVTVCVEDRVEWKVVSTEHVELTSQNDAYVSIIHTKNSSTKYHAQKKFGPDEITSYASSSTITYDAENDPFVTIYHKEVANPLVKYTTYLTKDTTYDYHIPKESVNVINLGY